MKVRVQEGTSGFFANLRRHESDVFTIPDEPRRTVSPDEVRKHPELKSIVDGKSTIPRHYSYNWMEPVDARTPERTSTAQQQINRKHDEEVDAMVQQSAGIEGEVNETADTGGDIAGEDSANNDDVI